MLRRRSGARAGTVNIATYERFAIVHEPPVAMSAGSEHVTAVEQYGMSAQAREITG
jgi:hypothetical protein